MDSDNPYRSITQGDTQVDDGSHLDGVGLRTVSRDLHHPGAWYTTLFLPGKLQLCNCGI